MYTTFIWWLLCPMVVRWRSDVWMKWFTVEPARIIKGKKSLASEPHWPKRGIAYLVAMRHGSLLYHGLEKCIGVKI